MKYKRVVRPDFIEKPIPKKVQLKTQIRTDLLLKVIADLDKNLENLKEGQGLAIYYRFQVYDETNEEARLIRNSKSYKQWRNEVLSRDSNTCQNCFTPNAPVVAHHIEHFNQSPERRLDVTNGITLCVGCHKEIHTQEGYI